MPYTTLVKVVLLFVLYRGENQTFATLDNLYNNYWNFEARAIAFQGDIFYILRLCYSSLDIFIKC